MTERWMPVRGYEGRYEVSDRGRVRALERRVQQAGYKAWTRPAQMMTVRQRAKDNYWQVALTPAGGKQRMYLVHALVLEAFVGPRPPKHDARHLDGNKSNNHLTNLAWGSHTENMYDIVRHGRHWSANKTRCKWDHEFTPANTAIDSRGKRQCVTCRRRRDREGRLAKKIARAA